MIILLSFLEKLKNSEYNISTLVDKNANYHGFFVFQKSLCSQQKRDNFSSSLIFYYSRNFKFGDF